MGGFFEDWQGMAQLVSQAVRERLRQDPSLKVVLAGHGLGSPMAVLAALDFAFVYGFPVSMVMTFGQPRLGNQAFATYYKDSSVWPTWRITHWRDPVPHIPTANMGFYHVGHEVWYNKWSTKYRVCQDTMEDGLCSNALFIDVGFDDHLTYLGYHIYGNYLECMASSAADGLVKRIPATPGLAIKAGLETSASNLGSAFGDQPG